MTNSYPSDIYKNWKGRAYFTFQQIKQNVDRYWKWHLLTIFCTYSSWYKYSPRPNRAHALQKAISSAAATGSTVCPSVDEIVPDDSRCACVGVSDQYYRFQIDKFWFMQLNGHLNIQPRGERRTKIITRLVSCLFLMSLPKLL